MSAKKTYLLNPSKSNDLSTMPLPYVVASMKGELKSISSKVERLLVVIENLENLARIDFDGGINLRSEVRRFEIAMINLALSSTRNQLEAAALLQTKATTLNSKIKKYGIS